MQPPWIWGVVVVSPSSYSPFITAQSTGIILGLSQSDHIRKVGRTRGPPHVLDIGLGLWAEWPDLALLLPFLGEFAEELLTKSGHFTSGSTGLKVREAGLNLRVRVMAGRTMVEFLFSLLLLLCWALIFSYFFNITHSEYHHDFPYWIDTRTNFCWLKTKLSFYLAFSQLHHLTHIRKTKNEIHFNCTKLLNTWKLWLTKKS